MMSECVRDLTGGERYALIYIGPAKRVGRYIPLSCGTVPLDVLWTSFG